MNVYAWSLKAKVGECIVYHKGAHGPRQEVANSCLKAHADGTVFLFQRRHSEGNYDYCVIRITPECWKRLETISAWWPKGYTRKSSPADPGEANSRTHLNRRYG